MILKRLNFSKLSIIVITVIFLAIAALVVLYSITVDDEILEVTRQKMQDIGVQMGIEIERSINESEDDLSLLAEYAANADINLDNAVDFFNTQSQAEEFDSLFYIDMHGHGVSADNITYDFSQNEEFTNTLNSDFFITQPHISLETGDYVFDVAVPIIKDGEVNGVLLSEVHINDLYELMDSTAQGGWIFLIDYDLNIFFTTSLGHTDDKAVPSNDIETLGMDNVTAALDNVKNHNSGSFTYVANYGSGNTQKILVYSPIEMTNWILAISIEENAINIDLETALKQITNISMLILLIILFFVVYIWLYRIYTLRSLEKTAYYDSLTELPNLTKLKKDMHNILSNNKNKRYSVVKIDIANFKAINEMFGFDIGNRVLKTFKLIRETVDEPSLIISRTGVDEFILFSGNGFLDDMEKRTNMYESFYQKLIPEIGKYQISFKYGRYHIALGDTNVDDIINKLNLAHRMSKDNKDTIIYDYDENHTRKLLEEAELTSKMNDALSNHEFEVYLQPKFSLTDESIIGAEALVRWKEKDGNMIYPNSFIPLFEKNGFIVELDKYVLDNVCSTISKWIKSGIKPVPISVNCSRLNLNDPNFVKNITKIVGAHNIPHGYIEIELTETITIENEEIMDELFADLRNNGFKISIDDFGAGYSSLGLLKNLKVDTLKMDRSFFTGIKESIRGEHVVDGFIKLAHNLEMYVVAEGIEVKEQIDVLRRLNCNAVQGFYYAKPMPIHEFEEKYHIDMN